MENTTTTTNKRQDGETERMGINAMFIMKS